MKRYLIISLSVVVLLCFSACHSADSRVDGLKNFVEEIRKESQGYTSEQWKKANERFNRLLDEIKSYDDLTKEELEELGKVQGQYAATVLQNCGEVLFEQLEETGVALDSLEVVESYCRLFMLVYSSRVYFFCFTTGNCKGC